MAELLKGAPVVAALNEELKERAAALATRGVTPTLAIVRLGERGDDLAYERGATKRCETIGVAVKKVPLGENTSQEYLIQALESLNNDPAVHGILLMRPLPKGMDEAAVCEAIAPEKDVDGVTTCSLAGVFTGANQGYAPCTAEACLTLLAHYGVDLTGKRAVVVGRSLVIGKPVAMLLLAKHATVTICHTRTKDLQAECRRADIIIAAAGKAGAVGAGCFSEGQTVVDVGVNVDDEGNMRGDADFGAAQDIVAGITPVPGGVGTVTTSVLVGHVVQSAERAAARA